MVISRSNFLDSSLSVESHSDWFICLHELIKLSYQIFILDCEYICQVCLNSELIKIFIVPTPLIKMIIANQSLKKLPFFHAFLLFYSLACLLNFSQILILLNISLWLQNLGVLIMNLDCNVVDQWVVAIFSATSILKFLGFISKNLSHYSLHVWNLVQHTFHKAVKLSSGKRLYRFSRAEDGDHNLMASLESGSDSLKFWPSLKIGYPLYFLCLFYTYRIISDKSISFLIIIFLSAFRI